jgi:hypothetical protein
MKQTLADPLDDPRSLSRCLRFLCLYASALAAGRHQQKNRAGSRLRNDPRSFRFRSRSRHSLNTCVSRRSFPLFRSQPPEGQNPRAYRCDQGYLADLLAGFQKRIGGPSVIPPIFFPRLKRPEVLLDLNRRSCFAIPLAPRSLVVQPFQEPLSAMTLE